DPQTSLITLAVNLPAASAAPTVRWIGYDTLAVDRDLDGAPVEFQHEGEIHERLRVAACLRSPQLVVHRRSDFRPERMRVEMAGRHVLPFCAASRLRQPRAGCRPIAA